MVLEYNIAKDFLKKLNLKSIRDYKELLKNNREEFKFLPMKPECKYKGQFEGYIIFLNLKKRKSKSYLSYQECIDQKNIDSILEKNIKIII